MGGSHPVAVFVEEDHSLAAAHHRGIRLQWAKPENTFAIEAPPLVTKPDFSAVFAHSGMNFNRFWERDRHTESIDSLAPNSVRNKLLTQMNGIRAWETGEIT